MNAAQIRERARAIEKEKALQAQRVARHLAGIQSVPSAEDARARDAEPTRALPTFRGTFMPKLRPARPQSFGSAQSYEIFDDDDDVVEPSDQDEDDKEAAGVFRNAETPTTCPGCLAGDHGNAKTHTKEPGCRLYEMQSIRERKELVGLLEREEKLVQEQEKLEKLRRLREEMSPGAASKSDDGLRIPSAPPAPSERDTLKSEMRSIIREELRDLMREERERIAGGDVSEASATPSRPSATEERAGGERLNRNRADQRSRSSTFTSRPSMWRSRRSSRKMRKMKEKSITR